MDQINSSLEKIEGATPLKSKGNAPFCKTPLNKQETKRMSRNNPLQKNFATT